MHRGGGDTLRQLHALANAESELSVHQKRLSEIEAKVYFKIYFSYVQRNVYLLTILLSVFVCPDQGAPSTSEKV